MQNVHISDGDTSDNDNVRYVDSELYATLTQQSLSSVGEFAQSDADVDIRAVERFLYWEARLLDQGQYRRWLELMSEECIYWVPSTVRSRDPRAECSINFEDRRRLIDRVVLIETGMQMAQLPKSRVWRQIGNVEAWKDGSGGIIARSNVHICESRAHRMTSYIGWQEHRLSGPAGDWRIERKTIYLLDPDAPQGNNTFIL